MQVYVQKVDVQVRGRDELGGEAWFCCCLSLLGRLIFLTVVYGRTAVRRRKVDGKICFPAACQKLDEGGKQNWDCQGLDNKIPAGNWRRSSCLSNPVWSVCGYLPSLFFIEPTFDSLK